MIHVKFFLWARNIRKIKNVQRKFETEISWSQFSNHEPYKKTPQENRSDHWHSKNDRETRNQSAFRRSQKPSVVFGTGVGVGNVRAISQRDKQKRHTQHITRSTTGVFVSRFQPHTSTQQVNEHIWYQTGRNVEVKKLTTKYSNYCSFYLKTSDRNLQKELMDSDSWPKGILIKPYID